MAYCTLAQLKSFIGSLNSDTFTAAAATDICTRIDPAVSFATGDPVYVETTGTLPGGLSASTVYYYILSADLMFKLASTSALADAGTGIDLTSAGSGTHTIQRAINYDDDELEAAIDAAMAYIDAFCNRTFEASANSDRTFDAVADVAGRVLHLDEDLCSIDSITNGDGVEVASDEYTTEPRNDTPYHAIRLLTSSGKTWTYEDDPEDAITISGRWAFSESAPEDIVYACKRLATLFYREKDVLSEIGMPAMGGVPMIGQIPKAVYSVLYNRKRRVVG